MKKRIAITVLSALAIPLGACSDEPSEASMRHATVTFMGRLYNQQVAAASFFMGGGRQVRPMPTITEFRKVHCESATPNAGHLCAFDVRLDGGAPARDQGRFFKDADGTVAMAAAGR